MGPGVQQAGPGNTSGHHRHLPSLPHGEKAFNSQARTSGQDDCELRLPFHRKQSGLIRADWKAYVSCKNLFSGLPHQNCPRAFTPWACDAAEKIMSRLQDCQNSMFRGQMQDGETRAACTCVLDSPTAIHSSSRTTTQALIAWSCGTRILRFDVLQRSTSELQRLLTGPPAA